MESIAHPSATKPKAVTALNMCNIALCLNRFRCELRMLIHHLSVDLALSRLVVRVERHEDILGSVEVLQAVQPIRDEHRLRFHLHIGSETEQKQSLKCERCGKGELQIELPLPPWLCPSSSTMPKYFCA